MRNRIHEIGILLSIGRSKLQITAQVLVEGLLIGVAAFLLATLTAPAVSKGVADYLVGYQIQLAEERAGRGGYGGILSAYRVRNPGFGSKCKDWSGCRIHGQNDFYLKATEPAMFNFRCPMMRSCNLLYNEKSQAVALFYRVRITDHIMWGCIQLFNLFISGANPVILSKSRSAGLIQAHHAVDVFVHGYGIKIILDTLEHNGFPIGDIQPQLYAQLPIEFTGRDRGEADIVKLYHVGVSTTVTLSSSSIWAKSSYISQIMG